VRGQESSFESKRLLILPKDAMTRIYIVLSTLLVSAIALTQSTSVTPTHPDTQLKIIETYGKLPLSFEANQGQTDERVKFLSRGPGYALFLTDDEAVFSLREGTSKQAGLHAKRFSPDAAKASSTVLRMKLVKANRAAKITGGDELPGKSNYFIGNNPKKWRNDVPEYEKVKYNGVYSGIDLVYYGNQRQLEYDFVLAPGADPHRIQFDIRGAKRISRDKSGDLVLQISDGELRWHKPLVYQEKGGERTEIEGRYTIRHGRVGFELAAYDPRQSLIIDPVLGYSTYLGGSNYDFGQGIAVDTAGNAYVTGYTESTNFPTMNPLQSYNGSGGEEGFVTKLNPSGSALVYSTYLGGTGGGDGAQAITVDTSGNAYVTGFASSTDFPTVNPVQATNAGGYSDAFVAKLNPTGSALVYSTYLGGSGQDQGNSIAVDSSGNAYLIGVTFSTDFPTANPMQVALGGVQDAFVTELNASGSALVYSTYFGGSSNDSGSGIAVDSSGNAYVTGYTASTDFPIMNPLQSYGGDGDAYVAKLNATGSALVYSTFLGGSGNDNGSGIAVDVSGNAYVTGNTQSTNFPTMNPVQLANGGSTDAFVAKLNASGSALVYSTYLGGSGNDLSFGIAVDSSGYAFVTGYTDSTNFPTVNPVQPKYGGDLDAFVAKLSPTGSALVYSTYFGGNLQEEGTGIAVDNAGHAYFVGVTFSSNFPTTPGAFQTTCGGGCNESTDINDAFVATLSPTPVVTLSTSSLSFGNQNVGTTSTPRSLTLTNSGDGALNIGSISPTGDFSQINTCPVSGSLAAGSNCTISVTFAPGVEGTRNGALTITDDAIGSPQSVSLSGVGIGPLVMLSSTGLRFGNQTVGIASASQILMLTNTGNGPMTVTSVSITGANKGSFSETNNCVPSVAAGKSCTITVSFKPNLTGSLGAAVTIKDNAPGSPQSVSLSGVGVRPAVTLAPTVSTFADQTVYTTSKVQTVKLTNTGLGILKISKVTVTGPFTQTNTCGSSVNPGISCTFSVTFKPTTIGALTGSITLTDNAAVSTQSVTLKGTGTYILLAPTTENFGTQPVGTTSLAKTITLTNKGSVAVSITKISIVGLDPGDFSQTHTCGTSVAAGASCFIKVKTKPTATGTRTASVSVADDGGGSPQKVSLVVTGT